MIENGLVYYPEKQRWVATYPVVGDLAQLEGNRNMVNMFRKKLMKRLIMCGNLENNVFIKKTAEDFKYEGVVNFVVLTEAYKTRVGTTTPIRICMNSSQQFRGVSLNDLLVTGPNRLNCQLDILLKFRCKKAGLVMDVRTHYNSVYSPLRDMHLRTILHADDPDQEPDEYLTGRVNLVTSPPSLL